MANRNSASEGMTTQQFLASLQRRGSHRSSEELPVALGFSAPSEPEEEPEEPEETSELDFFNPDYRSLDSDEEDQDD